MRVEKHFTSREKRPIISQFNRCIIIRKMVDFIFGIFAVSLIIITITGIFINKGKKGIWGRGGIELLAGIIVPILFMLLL